MSIIDRAGEKLKHRKDAQGAQEKPEHPGEMSQKNKEIAGASASMLEQIGEIILDDKSTRHLSKKENNNQRILNIDIENMRRGGMLPLPDMQDQLTNAFRRIKRPLLAKITGRGMEKVDNGDRIMITSALPGEGKSFAAFNLALSLAQEKDWHVILIDCDNIRQTITSFLSMSGHKGFFDFLSSDELPVNEILFETNIKNLSFVPSGTQYEHAAEMLSSKRMETVLKQIKGQHSNRIVLFDTPPLLGMSESLFISEHVGQILFVVKAVSTQRQIVADALQMLDHSKAIGFMLNQTPLSQDEGYSKVYSYYKGGRVQ